MIEITESKFDNYILKIFSPYKGNNFYDQKHDGSSLDINILPVEDLSNGSVGSILLRQNKEDNSEIVVKNIYKIFDAPKKITCKNIDVFKKFFDAASKHEYYMCQWDDPRYLQVGFMVFKRGKIRIYAIGLNHISPYISELNKKVKEKLSTVLK